MPLLILIKCISRIKERWENSLTGSKIFQKVSIYDYNKHYIFSHSLTDTNDDWSYFCMSVIMHKML